MGLIYWILGISFVATGIEKILVRQGKKDLAEIISIAAYIIVFSLIVKMVYNMASNISEIFGIM